MCSIRVHPSRLGFGASNTTRPQELGNNRNDSPIAKNRKCSPRRRKPKHVTAGAQQRSRDKRPGRALRTGHPVASPPPAARIRFSPPARSSRRRPTRGPRQPGASRHAADNCAQTGAWLARPRGRRARRGPTGRHFLPLPWRARGTPPARASREPRLHANFACPAPRAPRPGEPRLSCSPAGEPFRTVTIVAPPHLLHLPSHSARARFRRVASRAARLIRPGAGRRLQNRATTTTTSRQSGLPASTRDSQTATTRNRRNGSVFASHGLQRHVEHGVVPVAAAVPILKVVPTLRRPV